MLKNQKERWTDYFSHSLIICKILPPVRLWIITSSPVSQQLLQREEVAPLAEKEPQRV
ncbi:hypothetical protein KKE26_05455 [bacterium]|nr:hypothetical protein [bacterium]